MSRNLKPEYLKKLASIKTSNGYKVDLANYIYNPSFNHEYPSFKKLISETETEKTYKSFYYFKYYNGTGDYITETYTAPKDKNNSWVITKNREEKKLESCNRFSLKRLIELTEQIV